MTEPPSTFYTINTGHLFPKASKWTCYTFGNRPGGSGMSYRPSKDQVPNHFVRFMMRICFDCLWVRDND